MTTSNEHNNAPAVPQGWRDAASAALTLLNKTQRALGNNLAKHPADHFATVGELMGMHDCRDGFLVRSGLSGILNDTDPSTNEPWPKSEPVRLSASRIGRVYVAGPMTGLPERNFPAFNQEAERLRAEGLQVLNPADHGIVDGADWADYLRHDIAGLASCERIHLLRGWTKSKGACLEMTIAKALGMTVTYQVDAEMEHNNAPAVPQGEPTEAMLTAGLTAAPEMPLSMNQFGRLVELTREHLSENTFVYKATSSSGETCYFGVESAAKAWAKGGTVEAIKVREFKLHPLAPTAAPVGEREAFEELIEEFEAAAIDKQRDAMAELTAKYKEQLEIQDRLSKFGLEYDKLGPAQKAVIALKEQLNKLEVFGGSESEKNFARAQLATAEMTAGLERRNAHTIDVLKNEAALQEKEETKLKSINDEVEAMRIKVATYGMAKGEAERLEEVETRNRVAQLEAMPELTAAQVTLIGTLKEQLVAREALTAEATKYGQLEIDDKFAKLSLFDWRFFLIKEEFCKIFDTTQKIRRAEPAPYRHEVRRCEYHGLTGVHTCDYSRVLHV